MASAAGCNAVKFQKRTIETVYSREELARARESPFGLTNGDLKRGLEFGLYEYHEIDRYCHDKNLTWFASCWDEGSVDFIDQFDLPCFKIASASLTDDNLLRYIACKGKPIILSTGMSTAREVERAVSILDQHDIALMHTCSTYPSRTEELNLRVIATLRDRYGIPVGYSGHEGGILSSIASVALGASIVERHITLDRNMWGSDQAASIEVDELRAMVRGIREIEMALGESTKRLLPSEVPVLEKLRRVGAVVQVAS